MSTTTTTTGRAWGDWALYTDSPLRAFENKLGVQDPVGFWDPAGFTADGNVENFQRRRQTELKHGRVSMLATMGYITPEITGKLPGYLSPSMGIKFADAPNGLAAISKVPSAGWAQILAYGAFCKLSQDQSPGTAAASGDFGFKVLTSSDPAEKTKKLSAELANGRLAMMAIIGMFFQDGLTGSAWGDWALYTDSPLRAFENELGVQDPVGSTHGLVIGQHFESREDVHEDLASCLALLRAVTLLTPPRMVCLRPAARRPCSLHRSLVQARFGVVRLALVSSCAMPGAQRRLLRQQWPSMSMSCLCSCQGPSRLPAAKPLLCLSYHGLAPPIAGQ